MMGQKKLNVLIYTGTGTTKESVRHCLTTFTTLLTPNYAIIPVTESHILKEPWPSTTALLVVPGGGDLGYCRVLNGEGNRKISDYVRKGGSYLGFCAGGYYGSRRCEFEKGRRGMEVIGSRELGFFEGTCRGGAFAGFEYGSERAAKAPRLKVNKGAFVDDKAEVPEHFTSYFNGGGVFVDASEKENVDILAEYEEDLVVDGGNGTAAVVLCKVGSGKALLTGPHPEFAPENLHPQPTVPDYDGLIATLKADSQSRCIFLKACLTKLGLEVPEQQQVSMPKLSPLHLSTNNSDELQDLLSLWDSVADKDDGRHLIRAEVDTFHLQYEESLNMDEIRQALEDGTSSEGVVDYSGIVKRIIAHEARKPTTAVTPKFDHERYYRALQTYRRSEPRAKTWGDLFMYGDTVTSTNSLLEKNPKLTSHVPSGFAFAASTQLAGRGRGTNVWVAPPGSLLFSVVIKHPASLALSRPVVFIQYLAAVAIVEAVQAYGQGYKDLKVKLKWPNDIYAADPTQPSSSNSYVKIGGILSQCGYSDGSYQVVLGIGLNVNNPRPTTSISDLLPSTPHDPLHLENLLACLLTRLEAVHVQFIREGFSADLESRYYQHWLHTGQSISIEQEAGKKARVLGITRDWGMLKVEETDDQGRGTGKVWALQSDENSFDFWKGLVKRKL